MAPKASSNVDRSFKMTGERDRTVVRRVGKHTLIIGILLAAFANLLLLDVARAASYPRLSESLQYLKSRYNISVEELARYLSATGPNVQDRDRSRLVRWEDEEFDVAIVIAGDARDEGKRLAKNMIALFDQIHRRSKFCLQNIETAEAGDDYAPSAGSLECLNQHYAILVVVDASSRPTVKFLADLGERSKDKVEQKFWTKQMQKSKQSDFSNCDAGYSIDQDTNLLSSGTIYLRISTGAPDLQVLGSCLAVLPFRILGVPPIPGADYRETFDTHLLQMLYSPDLRPGMGLEEVERALQQ
jgi:hypothetical protein